MIHLSHEAHEDSNEGLAHKNSRARSAFLAAARAHTAYSRRKVAYYRTSASYLPRTHARSRSTRRSHPRHHVMVASRTGHRLPEHAFRFLQRQRPHICDCLRAYRLRRQWYRFAYPLIYALKT